MAGEGRQDKNRIFVGDQLEAVCKVLRRAVKFRAKLPVLFAIRLDPPVQAGQMLRVSADKEFALQNVLNTVLGRDPADTVVGNKVSDEPRTANPELRTPNAKRRMVDSQLDSQR
jgi:hypothetical protein